VAQATEGGEKMKETARILAFKGLDLRSHRDIAAAEEALMNDLISGDITPVESRKIQKDLNARIRGIAGALKTLPLLGELNKLAAKVKRKGVKR
jgi:hypothetical protein